MASAMHWPLSELSPENVEHAELEDGTLFADVVMGRYSFADTPIHPVSPVSAIP
jgi:hypothetical protein